MTALPNVRITGRRVDGRYVGQLLRAATRKSENVGQEQTSCASAPRCDRRSIYPISERGIDHHARTSGIGVRKA